MVARGFYEELDHPSIGRHPVPSLPYKFAGVPRWTQRATPTLGQDNHDVLTRVLGKSAADIAALEDAAIIGTRPKGT